MKKVYRIEIQAPGGMGRFKHWIGANGALVLRIDQAVPCTHEEHLAVMESLNAPAVAYSEEMSPAEEGEVAARADSRASRMEDARASCEAEGTLCKECDEHVEDCTCHDISETKLEEALCEMGHTTELSDLVAEALQMDGVTVDRIRSFDEAGVMTRNKGVVLHLENAKGEKFKFQLTIVQDRR